MMPPFAWDCFDKIYCITLDSRPDRMQAAARQFAEVRLNQRVEFLVVAKDEEDPVRGIYGSHLSCLAKGLKAGARHILVFEDDVFFRGFCEERLRAAGRFLEDTSQWDAFFLGCLTHGSRSIGQEAVVQINYRCLAHAYALSRPFAEEVVREPWQGIPFDELLRRRNQRFFALRPMCAFQGLASSDNETVWIDRLRNLCGGLPFIQRCNERYQNNKPLFLALHLLAAAMTMVLYTFLR